MDPGVESVRIAEVRQVSPGDHQRVLQGILGPIDVAEDPLCDREEPVTPNADQVDVRLPIPVPCHLDEVTIHGPASSFRARWGRRPNLLVVQRGTSFILRPAILAPRAGASERPGEGGSLVEFYPWVVFVHVAAAFLFVMGHGASMWVSDQIRRERDPTRIQALLELSSRSLGLVYASLLTLLVAGIAAGIMGGHFGRGWIWAAIIVLVAIIVLMYALASRYYGRVREAVGMRSYQTAKDAPDPTPISPEELAVLVDSRRPDVIGLVGVIGLLVLLWLMMFKPF